MIPEAFLQLANRMTLSRTSGPAEFRTSISRAYYAVYHLARDILNDKMQFYCKAGGNEHQWVQRHFVNCTTPDARDAGRILQNMHDARKDADYELGDSEIETGVQARFSLERANEVENLLRSCVSDDNLLIIKAEMLRYRALAKVQ